MWDEYLPKTDPATLKVCLPKYRLTLGDKSSNTAADRGSRCVSSIFKNIESSAASSIMQPHNWVEAFWWHCIQSCIILQALEGAAAYWDDRLAALHSEGDDDMEDSEEEWILPIDEEGVPWTARNSSELTPLINKEVMWLLKIAEDRMKNASGFHFTLRTARDLAHYTSIGYCLHENIQAWNCTRFVPGSALSFAIATSMGFILENATWHDSMFC